MDESDGDASTCSGQGITFSEGLAEIFSKLNSGQRIECYVFLCEGWSAKEISEEMSVSRSTLQNYVDDFKESGLISKDGNRYQVTRKGGFVRDILFAFDEVFPVVLAGSIADEIQGSGLEVDEEAVEELQGELIQRSGSYSSSYSWDEVESGSFWRAVDREDLVEALEAIRNR